MFRFIKQTLTITVPGQGIGDQGIFGVVGSTGAKCEGVGASLGQPAPAWASYWVVTRDH